MICELSDNSLMSEVFPYSVETLWQLSKRLNTYKPTEQFYVGICF